MKNSSILLILVCIISGCRAYNPIYVKENYLYQGRDTVPFEGTKLQLIAAYNKNNKHGWLCNQPKKVGADIITFERKREDGITGISIFSLNPCGQLFWKEVDFIPYQKDKNGKYIPLKLKEVWWQTTINREAKELRRELIVRTDS